jgi:hypothetical protein
MQLQEEEFQKSEATFKMMLSALRVIVFDRKISAWLRQNDPKALAQGEKAIEFAVRERPDKKGGI